MPGVTTNLLKKARAKWWTSSPDELSPNQMVDFVADHQVCVHLVNKYIAQSNHQRYLSFPESHRGTTKTRVT